MLLLLNSARADEEFTFYGGNLKRRVGAQKGTLPQVPNMFLIQEGVASLTIPPTETRYIPFSRAQAEFGGVFTLNDADPSIITVNEPGTYTFRFNSVLTSSGSFPIRLNFFVKGNASQIFANTELTSIGAPENFNLRYTVTIDQPGTQVRVGFTNTGTTPSVLNFLANSPSIELIKLSPLNPEESTELSIPHFFGLNVEGIALNFLTGNKTEFIPFEPQVIFNPDIIEMGESSDQILLKKPGRYLVSFDSTFFLTSPELRVQFHLNGCAINSSTTLETAAPGNYTLQNIITIPRCQEGLLQVGITADSPNAIRAGFLPSTVGINILYLNK